MTTCGGVVVLCCRLVSTLVSEGFFLSFVLFSFKLGLFLFSFFFFLHLQFLWKPVRITTKMWGRQWKKFTKIYSHCWWQLWWTWSTSDVLSYVVHLVIISDVVSYYCNSVNKNVDMVSILRKLPVSCRMLWRLVNMCFHMCLLIYGLFFPLLHVNWVLHV